MNAEERIANLSVVIPTMGRDTLIETLKSLAATQGFDSLKVYVAGKVAEGAVLDQLKELLERHRNITHLAVSFTYGDSSEKKNAGWRAADTELVAFLDDDVAVAPDWPEKITEAFTDEEVALVSGPSLVPDHINIFARLAGVTLQSKAAGYVSERYLKGQREARQIGWSRIIGCNMCYRRTILEELGGFDPAFWPGEEMIAAFITGKKHRLMFHPDAYVYHYPRSSLSRFWKQIHGYGATRVRLIRAGSTLEPTTIVPGLWVASLVVLIVMGLFTRWGWYLLWFDLVLYFLADLYITLSKYAETRRRIDLLIFFLVPVMHLSYGIAEWVEFFRPNKDLSEF